MKRAPNNISKQAHKLWREMDDYFQLEPHHYTLMELACNTYDRILEAREAVEKYGSFYQTESGFIRSNPAILAEHNAVNRFAKIWKDLGFGLEPPKDVGRPPGSN